MESPGQWPTRNLHQRTVTVTICHIQQVLAIDQDFGLFHRAWCVAELAEARLLRMPTHVPKRIRGVFIPGSKKKLGELGEKTRHLYGFMWICR